eukprot:GHVH01015578.1.p2 GENE.GHVH01015578.1~~GHVH01015578.1.p2  ORF type:complete len:287 (+),score=38.10 GHVH01015578.1:71-931(+)
MVQYVNESRCVAVEGYGAKVLVDRTGSQMVSWVTRDYGEQMYISASCGSPPEMSIRAGNPVCYPQFATVGPLSKHGIVRMLPWELVSNSNGKAVMKIVLRNHDDHGFNFSFTAVFTCEITGPNDVCLDLTVTNDDISPIKNQTVAFHPYFSVADIGKVSLKGFKGSSGFDKTGLKENKIWNEESDTISVPNGLPIDTMYKHVDSPIKFTVLDRGAADPRGNLKADLVRGFQDAVVWNIGSKDVVDLKDMPDEDWKHYMCMEQAQLTPSDLAPGAQSSWTTKYTVTK